MRIGIESPTRVGGGGGGGDLAGGTPVFFFWTSGPWIFVSPGALNTPPPPPPPHPGGGAERRNFALNACYCHRNASIRRRFPHQCWSRGPNRSESFPSFIALVRAKHYRLPLLARDREVLPSPKAASPDHQKQKVAKRRQAQASAAQCDCRGHLRGPSIAFKQPGQGRAPWIGITHQPRTPKAVIPCPPERRYYPPACWRRRQRLNCFPPAESAASSWGLKNLDELESAGWWSANNRQPPPAIGNPPQLEQKNKKNKKVLPQSGGGGGSPPPHHIEREKAVPK